MILALLKLIPVKDLCYGAAIILLLAAFGWYTVHERHEGAAKIEAADQRTAMVAEAKDKAIEAAGQAAANTIGEVYEKAVRIPAVDDLGVVCHTTRSSGVSQAADNQRSPDATPARTDGPSFDPTGAALTVGRDADALIAALQAQILDLVARMNGSVAK